MKKILAHSAIGFSQHKNTRVSAAIAYYMIFCLVPLLFLFTGALSLVLDGSAIQEVLSRELQNTLGRDAALFLQEHLHSVGGGKGIWVSALGIFLTLLGLTAVFKELKYALNVIFEVPRKKQRALNLIVHNLSTFLLLFATGLFITLSFLVTLSFGLVATPYLGLWIPHLTLITEALNFLLSFSLLTTFFMFLYTFVPDAPVAFRSTLFGSLFTAFCFTIGKTLFAVYIGTVGVASGYGVASAVLILLLWLFYSTQLFLFGAEITAQIEKHLEDSVD
jgi:membrane protein